MSAPDTDFELIRAMYDAAVRHNCRDEFLARILGVDHHVPPAPIKPVCHLRVVVSNQKPSEVGTSPNLTVSRPALRIVSRRPAKHVTVKASTSGSGVAS